MSRFCTFLCVFAVSLPASGQTGKPAAKTDYQKLANAATWVDPHDVVKKSGTDSDAYKVEWGFDETRISRGGKVIHTFHGDSGYVVARGVVYYPLYGYCTSGCEVMAYDLVAGKQLWQVQLKGVGRVPHSLYWNQVGLGRLDDQTLIVFGEELGQRRYLEIVDLKTGQTVGHKVFRKSK
jgi:hypothetical protein